MAEEVSSSSVSVTSGKVVTEEHRAEVAAQFIELFQKKYAENEAQAVGGAYTGGLEKLIECYDELDITGHEKAQLVAQYLINTTSQMVAVTQQTTAQMTSKAFTAAYDLASAEAEVVTKRLVAAATAADEALKRAQIDVLKAEKLLKETQIELMKAQKDLLVEQVAMQKEELNLKKEQVKLTAAELELKKEQLKLIPPQVELVTQQAGTQVKEQSLKAAQKLLVDEQTKTQVKEQSLKEAQRSYQVAQEKGLETSLVQNTLIKLYTENNSMIGTMGSGAVVASKTQLWLSALLAYEALSHLNTYKPGVITAADLENVKPKGAASAMENTDLNIPQKK